MDSNASNPHPANFQDTDVVNRIIYVTSMSNDSASNALNSSTTGSTTLGAVTQLKSHDAEILEHIQYYEMVLSTVVISFGIICNVLTLLTLRDPDLKEAPYTYLKALAWADLSALILAFSMYLIKNLGDYVNTRSYFYNWWSAHMYYPLINFPYTMGIWIIVVMTIERCLYLQFPFQVRAHFTNKKTRIKIMVVFAASFIVNFPRFLWYMPVLDSRYGNHSNSYTIDQNFHGEDFAVVVTWIHSFLVCCLPLVLLIFLNAFLIYKFHSKRSRRFELGISRTIVTIWDREQSRMTFTYIAIVGLFIILIMPSAFADENVSSALFGGSRKTLPNLILQYVSNFLIWLNLSLNFAMYAFINTKFKRSFKFMLRRWRARMRYFACKGCKCSTFDLKRASWSDANTFNMACHDSEQTPFNNNKNRLQNQQSNMSSTSKENSFTTVTFRLIDG